MIYFGIKRSYLTPLAVSYLFNENILITILIPKARENKLLRWAVSAV